MTSNNQGANMKQVELQDGASADIVQENVQHLKELFPDAFTENGVNFDTLRQLLGDLKVLDEGEEKYGLNWHGKKQARQIALTPSLGTLLPCPEESVDWDTTQNLFIEGDNLEVLKLLQKSYANKVKLIYIDPPYNTGNEFVYPDKFQDNLDTYLKYTGQIGDEGLKFTSNTETGGRKHTNWLNMMYPRLKLAKQLLRNDGFIFISIDDNEEANLVSVCKEIFGEENYLANIAWKHTQQSKNDEPYFSRNKNSIIVFRKSDAAEQLRLPRTEEDNKNYSNSDNDPRGMWRSGDVRSPSFRQTLRFKITTPSGKVIEPPENGWRWTQDAINEKIETGEIVFSPDETKIIRKIYLENQEGRTPENVWLGDRYGTTRGANTQIKQIFDGKVPFDTPKPVELIQNIINLIHNDKECMVMDFFAGSATSAESVLRTNIQDNGSRKFIMVQLPETLDETKKEQKEAAEFCNELSVPQNISELAKERIRRASKKIKEKNPDYDGDLGFKVFKLASSNIKVWNPDRTDLEGSLLDHKEHLVEGRSEQDILYELLLKRGVDLTTPIETREIAGKNVYSIGFGKIITCLDDLIAANDVEPLASGIIAWQKDLKDTLGVKVLETHVFFKDSAFRDDVAKTNMAAILSQNGIDHVRSL